MYLLLFYIDLRCGKSKKEFIALWQFLGETLQHNPQPLTVRVLKVKAWLIQTEDDVDDHKAKLCEVLSVFLYISRQSV